MLKNVESAVSNLDKMGVNGYIGFSVKAKDNEHNRKVIKDFLGFAKTECGDNYTLALKELLEAREDDNKYEILTQRVLELEEAIDELRGVKRDNEVSSDGVF